MPITTGEAVEYGWKLILSIIGIWVTFGLFVGIGVYLILMDIYPIIGAVLIFVAVGELIAGFFALVYKMLVDAVEMGLILHDQRVTDPQPGETNKRVQ